MAVIFLKLRVTGFCYTFSVCVCVISFTRGMESFLIVTYWWLVASITWGGGDEANYRLMSIWLSILFLLTGVTYDGTSADSLCFSLMLDDAFANFSTELNDIPSPHDISSSEREISHSVFYKTLNDIVKDPLTEQNWSGNIVGSEYSPSLRILAKSMVTLPTNLDWSGLLLEMRLSCTCVSFFRKIRLALSKATWVRITRSSLKSVLLPWGLYLAVSMLTFWLLVCHWTEKRQGKRIIVSEERTAHWMATEKPDLSWLAKFILYLDVRKDIIVINKD